MITERLTQKIDEIKKLYDVSEAEMQCLIQMSMLIKMLGYSPQLTTKLLKTLAAINEMMLDEIKAEDKEQAQAALFLRRVYAYNNNLNWH